MTSRRLVLVRHAKAAADGRTDAERALAARGRADAPAVGRWLRAEGVVPDRVVVSPARRAAETWDLAAAELQPPSQAVADDRLYANTVDDLLAVVHETPPDVATLALVGHNPGIEDLALALDDGSGDPGARDELSDKYPTSGLAVFSISVEWIAVGPGTGTLVTFAVPRG